MRNTALAVAPTAQAPRGETEQVPATSKARTGRAWSPADAFTHGPMVALLVPQLATLSKTKELFDLRHVFHRPLVYVMFAIAALHVALASYLGSSFVRF